MNIIRNDKLINRNSKIGQFALLGGLVVLAGGMFLSFRYPEQYGLSLAALMLGFLASQVGIYFSNRWGRRPRLDEQLDAALKGLDKKYTLYHYSSPVSHLLVGPSGVWVLLPYYQRGTMTYENGRWRQHGGNLYLKLFAQEGLGRPEAEVVAEVDRMQGFLSKGLPEGSVVPPVQAAMVFTNPKATISIPEGAEPPTPAVTLKELKELIRKAGKGKSLTPDKVTMVQEAVQGSD
jgi:hypothetical protein